MALVDWKGNNWQSAPRERVELYTHVKHCSPLLNEILGLLKGATKPISILKKKVEYWFLWQTFLDVGVGCQLPLQVSVPVDGNSSSVPSTNRKSLYAEFSLQQVTRLPSISWASRGQLSLQLCWDFLSSKLCRILHLFPDANSFT